MKKTDLMLDVAMVLSKAIDKNITKSEQIDNKLVLDSGITYIFNILTDDKKQDRIELSADGLWNNSGCCVVIAEFCNNIKISETVKMLTEVILIYENYMKDEHFTKEYYDI